MPKIDSLYLHFPFCRHLCNYCDFYKTIPKDSSQDLINFERQLEDSFLTHQAFLEQNDFSWSELKTFYIGGGTPSLWGKQGAVFLSDWMKKRNLKLASDVEFTQEVNPGAWNNESLLAWQGAGVNRFSLGIQSYSQKFLEILDRFHDLEEAKRTLKKLSELKVNYSTDLMLGLPFSQRFKRDVITELKSILEFYPSHFSVYILTVKDHYKHFADLPSEEYVEEE